MTTGRRAAASPWAARGGRGRVRVVPPRPRGAEDPAAQPVLLPAGGSAWLSAEFRAQAIQPGVLCRDRGLCR